MKKGNKVLLSVVGIIVATGVGIGIWQHNNVRAVMTAYSMGQNEIVTKIEENKEEAIKAMENYNIIPIRDLTFEEEEKIRKGEMTPEEAIRSIMDSRDKTLINKQEVGKKQNDEKEVVEDKNIKTQEIVQDAVATMYALKAEYLGKLGGMEQTAKGEYLALPKEERGMKGKQKIISRHAGEVMGFEGACDAKVNTVLKKLEGELKSLGEDTSIVGTMRSTYQNEKNLKKAYYMSLLVN